MGGKEEGFISWNRLDQVAGTFLELCAVNTKTHLALQKGALSLISDGCHGTGVGSGSHMPHTCHPCLMAENMGL